MPLPDFAQNGTFYAFYAFYAPRVQRQTHVRVHTSRVTNFAFDTYPRKMHFERRTAQKLARTIFRVVPNCARGGGGWIKSSSSLASEASALAFGQPARFARGLDNRHHICVDATPPRTRRASPLTGRSPTGSRPPTSPSDSRSAGRDLELNGPLCSKQLQVLI